MTELSQLKDTYRVQSEVFVYEIRKLEETMIKGLDNLTIRTQKINYITEDHGVKLNLHTSNLTELFGRTKLAEEGIDDLRR